jgi:Dolichyl-phosphate-mannose-protein mannosyltransferase
LTFRVACIAIGLTWIGLRVLYWNGYYTEDAPGYVSDAIWMALGNYHARDHVNGLNIGTYLPVALPIRLFGKSEIALSVWPLLCSLAGMVSLAWLSGMLFGLPFGLLAAFLYATYPGDVFFSTVVMPDSLQAAWISLSVFLVARAHVQPDRQKRLMLIGGGVALGVCHLIRANDVILVPVGICAVAAFSRIWKRDTCASLLRGCLAYLGGWMMMIAIEGLGYLWAVNDFFHRLRVVNQHYGTVASIARSGLNTDPNTLPLSLFAPVAWWTHGDWGRLNPDQAYHALIFCWALLSISAGLVALKAGRRLVPDRAVAGFVVALVWCAWPLLYHQFGSQSVTHFVPVHRLSRHFVVYAPGAIVAIVAGWFLIVNWVRARGGARGRAAIMAVGSAILVVHVYFNWKGEQIAYDAYHRIKGTYTRIREHLPPGVHTIVGDPGDLCFFDFWLNPLGAERVKMVVFANYSGCDELRSGVVLTQSNPGWERLAAPVIQETVRRLPCLLEPPPTWRLLYDGYPERVYSIEP